MKRARVVVVLGMHRSGTSAVARALKVMGVGLGESLMPAHPDGNPKGYWEDIDINALNIKILHSLGLEWHSLSPIENAQLDQLRQRGFGEQAIQLLQRKVVSKAVFGFKDPRVSKILPFWKTVFTACDFEVSYVLAIRHPLSVADSLAKRDGFPPIKSALLWLGHVLECLSCIEDGSLAVVIDYDRLMDAPIHELTRLASALDLKPDPDQANMFAEEFIEPELRHSHHRLSEFQDGDDWPPLLKELYAELLNVASGHEPAFAAKLLTKLPAWRRDFSQIKAALVLNDQLVAQQLTLASVLQERDAHIAVVQKQLSDRDLLVSNLALAVTEYGETTRSMKLAAISRERHLTGLGKVVSDREATINASQEQVGVLQQRIAVMLPSVESGAAEVKILKQTAGELTATVDILRQVDLDRQQRITELQQVHAELATKASGLEIALADQTSLVAQLDQTVGALEKRKAALTDKLAEHRREIDDLKSNAASREDLIESLQRDMDQYQLQTAALMATHQMDIDLHRSAMAQRDREIAVNHHALADRDTTIGNIGKALSEYLDLIGSMNQRKQDYERRILDLSSASEERNAKLNRLVMEHDALLADMADLRNSWGNRLGSTVRRVFGFGSVPLPGPQGQTGNAAGGPSTGAAGAPVSDLDALLRLRGSQFIESLYRTLLRRPPDPDGFRHYRRKIDAGANLMQLVSDVANSAEAVNKRVVLPGLGEAVALHRTSRLPVVGRRIVKPDFFRPSEIPAGLGRKLLKVDELVALDDGPFLDKAYHLILKRKADPEGVAFYQNKLRRGVPALVILEDLLDSPEAASLGADSLAWRSQVRWRRVASQPIAARLLPLGIPAHLKKIEPDQVSGNDGGVPGGAVVGSSMVTVAPASELGGWKSLAVKGTQGRAAPTSQVCVSVIMAAYKTPLALLRQTIASVQSQSYTRWELCICNDGSADPQLERLLEEYVKLEPRVRLVSLDANTGIATATNKAMELASGEFMAFLDHDDELTEDALEEVVRALSKSPDTDILYSDQDKIDESGRVLETFYKPDWSPDYLRRVMYVGHLLVVRSTLARQVGGFDPEFNRVQDYEFVLRLSEVTKNIIHVPKVLYHWRAIEGSIASTANAKGGIENLQCLAVQNHLNRLGLKGAVQPHPTFAHRAMVLPQGVGRDVRVSIIIPSKNHPEHIGRCLQSIFERSTYKNFEVIVVDNGTTDPEALAILALHPITVVPYDEKFSYSRANNLGAARASGEVLVLLNNDTEVLTDNWIELLLSNLWQSDIGVVGPMLVYPDRTVQHAGIVVGPRGTADHVMRGFPATSDGYAGSLSCVREVSGITGACLMTRLETYVQAGGLSELYATHYQDVDFCLGVRAQGKRILHVPEARLMHYESASRGNDYDLLDRLLLQDSWRDTIANGDPYFNPAFSLQRLDYSLRVV